MKAGVCSTFRLASLRALSVQRLRRQGDLAFAAAQLLQAHVGVRGDGEDQRVDRRLAGEYSGLAA